MVTVNAALALGKPDVLGRLRRQYWADMVTIPFHASRKNVFEEIVAFDGDVIGLVGDDHREISGAA
jgi:imidazolonepropionase-like amidohydrolase